jgi:hypothetical protein
VDTGTGEAGGWSPVVPGKLQASMASNKAAVTNKIEIRFFMSVQITP